MQNKPDNDIEYFRGLYAAAGKKLPLSAAPYCGHEGTREQLEGKLWEYAEGGLDLSEAGRFWEQVHNCRYCLQKLLCIQQAVNKIGQEKGYSADQIKNLIADRDTANVLRIIFNWLNDSLELLATTGLLLPPDPVPVTRNSTSTQRRFFKITQKFERCSINLLAQAPAPGNCTLEVEINPLPGQTLPVNLRINLLASQRLLTSHQMQGNRINFDALSCGNYGIELLEGAKLWGRVVLEIK